MKITVDTNVLVRAVVRDDEGQAEVAASLLREAAVVAVSLPCLCEFVWVLHRVYGFGRSDIAAALGALLDAGNVAVDRPAVGVGLSSSDMVSDNAGSLAILQFPDLIARSPTSGKFMRREAAAISI